MFGLILIPVIFVIAIAVVALVLVPYIVYVKKKRIEPDAEKFVGICFGIMVVIAFVIGYWFVNNAA